MRYFSLFALIALLACSGCGSGPTPEEDRIAVAQAAAILADSRAPAVTERVSATARELYARDRANEPESRRNYVAPRIVSSAVPTYPLNERRHGTQGLVWVAMMIDETGVPTRLQVVPDATTTTMPSFVTAALGAVAKWRFSPATVEGQPVESFEVVPIVFVLEPAFPANKLPGAGPSTNAGYKALANQTFEEVQIASRILIDLREKRHELDPAGATTIGRPEVDTPPQRLTAPKYPYPENWRATMERVWVTVLIDVTGRVASVACEPDPNATQPLQHANAVKREVASWRFTPALRHGSPTAHTTVFALVTNGTNFYLRTPDVF